MIAKGRMDGAKIGKRMKLSVKFCPRNLLQSTKPTEIQTPYLSPNNFFGRMLFAFKRQPSDPLSHFQNYLTNVKDATSAAKITASMS